MNLPTTLGDFLGDKSILGELITKEKADFAEDQAREADKAQFADQQTKKGKNLALSKEFPKWTFMQAIESLKLPKPQSKDSKKGPKNKSLSLLPSQMIQIIDLSGF